MKPTLLILAAGMGSRYGGLKQMDELGPNGEAIIDYSIYDAINAGFGKIVFVIRESFAEQFKEIFNARFGDKIALEYVYQELTNVPEGVTVPEGREKPWGTSHAVQVADEAINEPFAVINADDFYGRDAFEKLAKFLTEDVTEDYYSMIGYNLMNTLSDNGTVSRGVCEVDGENLLTGVVERHNIQAIDGVCSFEDENGKTQMKDETFVSMNMWGFPKSYFKHSKDGFVEFCKANSGNLKSEFYIPTVINDLIAEDKIKLKVLESKDKWFGVTYKEDKDSVVAKLKALHDNGTYPENLK
jgi:dTDP-glucose pyrophosphorylase